MPDYEDVNGEMFRFVVTDDDGRLHWRPITTLPDNCEWTMSGGANNHNVWTAVGTSNACPNDDNTVGIGTTTPKGKLHVVRKPTAAAEAGLVVTTTTDGNYPGPFSIAYGISASINNATSQAPAPLHYGISGMATNASITNVGVYGQVNNAANYSATQGNKAISGVAQGTNITYGVHGEGWGTALNHGVYGKAVTTGTTNYGVYGTALGTGGGDRYGVAGYVLSPATGYSSFGVFGEAPSTQNDLNATGWAGFFRGDLKVTGDTWGTDPHWSVSDSQFKTNIEDIENINEVLLALAPKSYNFIEHEHPDLQFNQGVQYGLIAQELEDVLPSLVRSTVAPAIYDTLGNLLHESVEHKGVNYTGLIPLLIAGHKEQQEVIAQQAATNANLNDQVSELSGRLDQLEQLLASCCQNPDGDIRDLVDDATGLNDPAGDRNLRIQPKPFNEQTTVYYNLERSGRMQLMANSSDGKQLRVLHEAQMEAGQYQYEWLTANLSAGVYYVTLLLDGEPIVKKAVKVN